MRFIQTTILLTVILALGTLGLFAAPIPEQPLDQVPEASVVAAEPSEDSPVVPGVPAFYRNQGSPKMNAATASFAGGVQQRLRVLDPELNECDCDQDGYGRRTFMEARMDNTGAAFGAGLRTLDRDRDRQTLGPRIVSTGRMGTGREPFTGEAETAALIMKQVDR